MGRKLWRVLIASLLGVAGTCVTLLLLDLPAASTAANSLGARLLRTPAAPIRNLAGAKADRPDSGTPSARALVSAAVPIGTWRQLGPAPIGPPFLAGGGGYGGASSGRITGLAKVPSTSTLMHPGRLVIGTAGGGIWTSDDGGTTWLARTDGAADLAVGSVTVDPSNGNHLIAGTGEANQCGDCFAGSGILVSTNGGTSWSLQNPGGVFTGKHVGQVAIVPGSSGQKEFAATDGGLYQTTNGGASWAKPTSSSYAALDGFVTAVVVNPSTPTTIYIAGQLGSGDAHSVAKSTDGGTTWVAADSGITAPGSGQYPLVALAIAPSSPATLYASVGAYTLPVAFYRTTTSGSSWAEQTATPDYTGQAYSYGSGGAEQGWYDNFLAVDPANASHVLAGGIALVETTTGGTSWTNVNGGSFFGGATNKIHPDQHALTFASDRTVWIGDDGGVFHYTPSTGAVANSNGHLGITQFYFGFNASGNTVLAGSQDNASARTSSSSLSAWTGIYGGDGGPSAITPNHTQTQFIEADQNLYVTTDGFSTTLINITPPSLGLFTPPMLVVPSATTPANPTVYYGGPNLYRTTNPTTGPTWSTVTSVGQYVSAIAASASGQYVYVGFTNGTIEVSTDAGLSFTPLAASPSPEQFVTGLSVNPANAKAITASFSYNDTRYRGGFPHVYQYSWGTSAGGGTWTNITGNLPNQAVSRVIYDAGALVAATDAGIYATGAPAGGSTSWSRVGSGLPNVQVQDLFVSGLGLYAATHGRGIWKLPAPADLAAAVTGPSSFAKGSNGTYTVTVTNNGPATASGVTLSDAVPAGTTFVSESQTAGPAFTCTNPALGATGLTTCKAGSLAAKASATFKLTYALPANTTQSSVTATAKVSSSYNPDPTPANNSATATTPVS